MLMILAFLDNPNSCRLWIVNVTWGFTYSLEAQVFYWIGWKPDPTKTPKPLEPGRDSDVSFKDIDNLDSVLHKFDPNKIDNDRGGEK